MTNEDVDKMTNLERWRFFMKDCTSPDSYIDMGFYYMIAASLQRRVWQGSLQKPLFPNLYIVLVGKAGIGKGLVISQLSSILREHKIEVGQKTNKVFDAVDKKVEQDAKNAFKEVTPEMMDEAVKKYAELAGDADLHKKVEDRPLLIPVAADATTYEALVKAMSKSMRHINYRSLDPKTGEYRMAIYGHSSLCFALEEMASLFRKKTEDVVNFLLQAYDCGDRYEYNTKTQGTDVVRKLCLNFLGGTTPDFMESIFNANLIDQGFSSRTMFVFEWSNRFNKMFISSFTPEQLYARQKLVEQVKKLTTLYGEIQFSKEATEYLEHWWEVEVVNGSRVNTSPRLDPYYGRKNVHIKKLSMVIHFSEAKIEPGQDTHMVVGIESCKKAMAVLENIEKKMHYALNFGGTNPLFKVGQKIIRYLAALPEGADMKSIMMTHWEDAKQEEIREIMTFLQASGKVVQEALLHPQTGQPTKVVYKVPTDAKR